MQAALAGGHVGGHRQNFCRREANAREETIMNILRSSVLILAAAAAFNLHADDGDIRQVRVSYAGLDL